jgi:hypothetical protein
MNTYHPQVPMIYFANGGSAFVERVRDTVLYDQGVAGSDGSSSCCKETSMTSPGQGNSQCSGSTPANSCCKEAPKAFGSSPLISPLNNMNSLFLDQRVDMATARRLLGPDMTLLGNVDPHLLIHASSRNTITDEVRRCVLDGVGAGDGRNGDTAEFLPGRHILSVGHGIEPNTPEVNVQAFVDAAKDCEYHKVLSS